MYSWHCVCSAVRLGPCTLGCDFDSAQIIPVLAPVDSSESSGESVSGFSSSGHSYHSAVGESEDSSSVCTSVITVKEAGAAQSTEVAAVIHKTDALPGSAGKRQPQVAPKLQNKQQRRNKDVPCSKVQ